MLLAQAPASRIYGGDEARTCEFPATLSAGTCSAFLIHPRVVISARHCGNLESVSFGESIDHPAKKVPVKWCRITPVSGPDAQICVLSEPIYGVPVAPLLQGCEVDLLKPGTPVYLAGFGYDEHDTADNTSHGDHKDPSSNLPGTNNNDETDTSSSSSTSSSGGDESKDEPSGTSSEGSSDETDTRETSSGTNSSTEINSDTTASSEASSEATLTEDPDAADAVAPPRWGRTDEKRWVRTQINRVEEDNLKIGGGGKGGCSGDSGGPAYIQLPDQTWRAIAFTHGGDAHPDCDEGTYMRTDVMLPWYEEQLKAQGETDIDITPCFDDEGKWFPTQACGGYALDIQGPFGDWGNNCSTGVPTQAYSATCGLPFGEFVPEQPKPDPSTDEPSKAENPEPKLKPNPVKPVFPKPEPNAEPPPGAKKNPLGEDQPPGSGCKSHAQRSSSVWLLLLGALGLGRTRRKRQRAQA